MATRTNGANGVPAEASSEVAPRKLKILMLHGSFSSRPVSGWFSNPTRFSPGYTQNGSLFHAKTRSLEKLLAKAFPAVSPKSPSSSISKRYPGGTQLFYPTAPIQLSPADIPGFNNAAQGDTDSDARGWFKRETGGGRYVGLEQGLDCICKVIKESGGIDGVIGFSQGAAVAAMVASLLEPGRLAAFEATRKREPDALRYPDSWQEMIRATGQTQLKFAVSYSGFFSPNELYEGFYNPKISTATCHFMGSLDSVVEESRSLALVDVCMDARKIYHPGGHFVPAGKEMAGVLIGFVKECCSEEKDECVEDMDKSF